MATASPKPDLTPSQIEEWCRALLPGDRVAIHKSDADMLPCGFIAEGKVMYSRGPHVYVNRDGAILMESLRVYFERGTAWSRNGYCIRPIEQKEATQ